MSRIKHLHFQKCNPSGVSASLCTGKGIHFTCLVRWAHSGSHLGMGSVVFKRTVRRTGKCTPTPALMHPVLKCIQAQHWHAYKVQLKIQLLLGLCSNCDLFFAPDPIFPGQRTYFHEKCSCQYPQEKIHTKQCLLLKLKAEHPYIWVTDGVFSLIHTSQANIKCCWSRKGSKHSLCGCFNIVHMIDEERVKWPGS